MFFNFFVSNFDFEILTVMILKKTVLTLCAIAGLCYSANAQDLRFDADNFTQKQLTMPDGYEVKFRAYENIFYVANVEDSVYQTLNIYVPDNLRNDSPIFLRTYIGGYLAAKAKQPSANDASGRALEEGYVVCIPGSRGSNSFVHKEIYAAKKGKKKKKQVLTDEFNTVYTGKFPAGLLDLKAAVRYLKANDEVIPGNSDKIITDGTSAGGAMSALLGVTGNHPDYEELLDKMGAAKTSDNIWASICFCPITDLEHADMAYEWLYCFVNKNIRQLDSCQMQLSEKLSASYPEYLKSLNLKNPETGEKLTAENYLNYLREWLLKSVNKAFDSGREISDTIGVAFYDESKESRCIVDFNLEKYLAYVAKNQPLKPTPAFDSQNFCSNAPSAENKAFGLFDGTTLNFTEFAIGHILPDELLKRVKMMNPMNYIADNQAVKAKNWYIRHGAKDRDTGFQISLNLALRLQNEGFNVNYFIPWDIPHTGDYNLNELFDWLETLE